MIRRHSHLTRRSSAALLSPLLLIANVNVAPAAQTEPARSEATHLAQEGVAAYEEGDFQTAIMKLSNAYQVLQVPSVGLWLGRSYAKVGKLVEAAAVLHEVRGLSPNVGKVNVQMQALRDAAEDEASIVPRIPHLILRFDDSQAPAPTSLRLDGREIAPAQTNELQAVNPGPHEVAYSCGTSTQTAAALVAEGETKTLSLTCPLPAEPSVRLPSPNTAVRPIDSSNTTRPSSGSRPTVALVSLGVGAAGLALGGISGIVAWNKSSNLDSKGCRDAHCPGSVPQSEVESLNTWRHVSTVGFAVGAVGVAAGLGFWLLTPKSETGSRAALLVGPQSLNVLGEFQ